MYFYAQTNESIENRLLHRYIMNAKKGDVIDHINHNTLDTRKTNLRICDMSKNGQNRKLNANNSSGYKGVTWIEKEDRWMAYLMIDQKFKNLGLYDSKEDAALARASAEDNYFGEYKYQQLS